MNVHVFSSRKTAAASKGGLRAGVVGAGAFGRHHATKYSKLPGVALVAIADPSAEARGAIVNALNVAAVANHRALFGKIDIVSICTPAATHAALVRDFLNAGIHVLVEKPIATDLDEAEELIALAAQKNLVLTVGHQERFVFARTGLLDFADAPLSVECVRAGPWTGRGADVSVVLDLMIHDLDLVHQIVPGHVADVSARAFSTHSDSADEMQAELVFDSGTKVSLLASRNADARERFMRVVYPDGEIHIDFITRIVTNTTGRELQPLNLTDPLGDSVASFVASAAGNGQALVRPEEARRALETALIIENAAAPLPVYRPSPAQAAVA